jgi:hypothetical protein
MTAGIGLEIDHDSTIPCPYHTISIQVLCISVQCSYTLQNCGINRKKAVNTITLQIHAFNQDKVNLLCSHLLCFQISECSIILNFEVSPDTMTKRLLHRAQTSGRVDDNEETIKKRLDTFSKHSKPVIEHFFSKCKTVSGLSGDLLFVEGPCDMVQIIPGAERSC